MARIRLYVDHPLGPAQRVPLSREQAHYLFNVMRLSVGDKVFVFNGQDGEWHCDITEAHKRHGTLICLEQNAPQHHPPDLWLVFAPIRKERMSFMVEKAVELGAARILPVQTAYAQSTKWVRQDKLQAHAIEAAEQCGATYVPKVDPVTTFKTCLTGWDQTRQILFCDEAQVGDSVMLPQTGQAPWAIFIGPEGGFSQDERNDLRALPCTHPISLGPRILRAETAALAALTLWQLNFGDWT